MTFIFRPLGTWTETETSPRRSRHAFKASWSSTMGLLERELDHLDAERIVLQADFADRDLRLDGMPRSGARQPEHPGIRIAFDSTHGPLTYATDAYEFWQHNVRAIALGLEALRAVDRYGVTRRGEQYTGWKQLEAGPSSMTPTDAARFIAEHGEPGLIEFGGWANLADPAYAEALRAAIRRAQRKLHPDLNPHADPALFQRLQEAKRVLEGAAT